ncbi:calcium-binding protein [Novispirillum sp. DQ9]|uniref:calcium-binding protein n=1 Tax=Novispirillum sp. DQ9 TaxID=3398612 RepID=UPI003C7C6AC6
MDPVSMLKTLFPGRYETLASSKATTGSASNVLSASLFGPSVILGGVLRSPEVMQSVGTDPNVVKQFGYIGTGSGSSADTSSLTRAKSAGLTVSGGDDSYAKASYGQGVSVGDRSVVEASGRVNVKAGDNSTVLVSGSAGSQVTVGKASVVIGGDGRDYITGDDNAAVRGGDGGDFIMVGAGSVVSGDDGDDTIYAGALSILDGGQGDDRLEAGVGSTLTGGAGDDILSIVGAPADKPLDYTASSVKGGAGNDTISITRAAVDIDYARGDGDDIIKGDLGLSTLNLKDARYADVSLTKVTTGNGNEDLVISFANSDDTITIKNANLAGNGDFRVMFRGGTEMTLSELMAV